MAKPTPDELYMWEYHFELAAAAILKDGGAPVISPFMPATPGPAEQQLLKDKNCFVRFEPAPVDPNVKAFATNVPDAEDEIDSIEAGWSGDLVIEHNVPVDDKAPEPGMPPGCYLESLRFSGLIRSIILSPKNPFGRSLPLYDILSVRYVQPQRGVDQPRSSNQATERFRITFMPARGML